jgi:hypothetical protein
MPIFEEMFVSGGFTSSEKKVQILKMKQQLGGGNLYHQLGFSFIYNPGAESELRTACELALETGIHFGLIFPFQSHTRDDFRAVADKDYRLYQWRKNGIDWKGNLTSTGTVEISEGQRDYKIPTPSRYATPLIEYNASIMLAWSESVKRLMDDYPGVITCINGPIEEELAIGGLSTQDQLADYSPFAITEFRDWLRHSGLYDASSGKFTGEGASNLLIGDLVDFNGTLRSQFYDDQSPDDNNGTGISFNEFYGTNFTTWSLRYWDMDMYPNPLNYTSFDCTPESGQGFCTGGFDAPRILNGGLKFWQAWSWDITDQMGIYPAGNPNLPAFGFRQNLTRNFVRDLFDVAASTGIPREIMYAHQIPGEALDGFTGGGTRNRSSASTIWSGYLDKSKTVGITRFGDIEPSLMTQYDDDWGIFEWHTVPGTDPNSQALYSASLNALNNYYQHKVHFLFPGWWSKDGHVPIFPLNDSKFADAIKDFMQARTEVPYQWQGAVQDYTPPRVFGISGYIDENKLFNVKWNERIWFDLVQKWDDWSQFAGFEIQISDDGINWSVSDQTALPVFTKSVTGLNYKIRVRAKSKKGLIGEWSVIADAGSKPAVAQPLTIDAEYCALYADPEINNAIVVTVGDSATPICADSLTVSISGDGQIRNTSPENVNSIEKFWPMDSQSEIFGTYRIDNMNFKGGFLSGIVSPVIPIDPYFFLSGSSVNGSQLPHFAFRLYSDIPSGGQVYWFVNNQVYYVAYDIKAGWNVYTFSNLPDWISQTAIQSVRLDPGTTASAKILVDWFAISSQPISEKQKYSYLVKGNQATFLTSPTSNPGSYTVTATIKKLTASKTIQTLGTNQKPTVKILTPLKDTTVVLGAKIILKAAAKDTDGKVGAVKYLLNNTLIQESMISPYIIDWIPTLAGSYQLTAEAFDNANDSAGSEMKIINVVEPIPFSGQNCIIPGLVEAEDYDIGGEKISFHDSDSLNNGGVYRTDPVDILKKTDNAHGYFIDWTTDSEWLTYTIEVKNGAKMDIKLLVSAKTGAGEIHWELNGKPLTNHQVIALTGDEQQFKTVSFKDIYFPAGNQKLMLVIDKGGIGIDYFEISDHLTTNSSDIFQVQKHLIYPNPASDLVTINVDTKNKTAVRIVALDGQIVKLYQLPPENKQISISDLTKGIYVVWIICEGQIFIDKLVKL